MVKFSAGFSAGGCGVVFSGYSEFPHDIKKNNVEKKSEYPR
jgi:hypothetical protein